MYVKIGQLPSHKIITVQYAKITQAGFKVPPVLLGHLPLLLFDFLKNVWLASNLERNSYLG